jgi:hypothetical protein
VLSVRDTMILEMERAHWRYPGAKETAIRVNLSMSATRYYQRLNMLLDDQEALAFAPHTVNRLRRLRSARRAMRASG